MAWVKRNLIFVITVAIGLIATGYCGYLLYSALGANATVSADYSTSADQYKTLVNAKPPATKENIQMAKDDQVRVKEFLGSFRKAFAPFPTPPPEDDHGFGEQMNADIRAFGAEATNNGISLPPNYSFSFSQQKEKLSFTPECIAPWMQELEEMKVILHIVFEAKINYLQQIQRPPACSDDNDGNDVLSAASVSNTWGVVTPYKLTFRCFSQEIATVLAGFADSSNCFIVKYINVEQSKEPLPQIATPTPSPREQQIYMPRPQYPNMMPGGERYGSRGMRGQYAPQQQAPVMMAAAPAAPTPPQTILQEVPLYVTLVVDAVKLKPPEKPAPAAVKPKLRGR
ncbi:MAG TPA: Amuc_1100 family pilus-like protein [Verrucomicrobiae bacterium]|jgi:hypothetical protein|nr:Amuc_1100 family pilus-like protein [Verrucomicrobiae bacterium]